VKTCTKCRTVKPLSEFHRDSRKSDGRRSRCKVCFNADQLAFQRRHKAETGQYYSRKYTYTRVCEVCGKTWQAKSSKARYCSTACTNKIPSYERTCEACGTVWLATQARARWCSTECSNGARYGWPTCRIPADHPVRAVPSPKLYRVYFPDCRWCGTKFTTQQPAHQLCSKYCVRREARARRKAREHRATGQRSSASSSPSADAVPTAANPWTEHSSQTTSYRSAKAARTASRTFCLPAKHATETRETCFLMNGL
jgi:hypothetical protein